MPAKSKTRKRDPWLRAIQILAIGVAITCLSWLVMTHQILHSCNSQPLTQLTSPNDLILFPDNTYRQSIRGFPSKYYFGDYSKICSLNLSGPPTRFNFNAFSDQGLGTSDGGPKDGFIAAGFLFDVFFWSLVTWAVMAAVAKIHGKSKVRPTDG